MKRNKHNIGIETNPKMAIVGDYWDEVIVSQVIDLIKEYEDMFPSTFSKIKGIVGDICEINIQLKPDEKPIKKRLYRLNPKYKEKV